jgi:two-component system phosphate regulon response regulator PhoB
MAVRKRILVVEDEEDILELIRYNLAKEGYDVHGVKSGEDALKKLNSTLPDLVILDLMLPGIDGFEICKIIKGDSKTKAIPIIMLTAKSEEADIVTGLELGADDYITKPFSPRILIARVRAALRRKSSEPIDETTPIKVHDILIHPGRHEVSIKGKPVDLSFSEFRILWCLARRPGWVFTRDQIIDSIHGADYAVTDRSIDVQVAGLRKKLGGHGKLIETIRSVGYRFKD